MGLEGDHHRIVRRITAVLAFLVTSGTLGSCAWLPSEFNLSPIYRHRLAKDGSVLDGFPVGAEFQIPFGHVGGLAGTVYEHVVPGLVFRGTTPRHLLVPLLGELEGLVRTHDDSVVVEEPVLNNLPGLEFVTELGHRQSPRLPGNVT